MDTRKAAIQVGSICLKVAVFVLIVLGIFYLGQTTYRYTHAVFSDAAYEAEPGKTAKINIPEDITAKDLSVILEENGLIKDAVIFRYQMKMENFGDTVKAGEYELNSSMAPSEMLQILSGQNKDNKT